MIKANTSTNLTYRYQQHQNTWYNAIFYTLTVS